jgi:hypothetical protein
MSRKEEQERGAPKNRWPHNNEEIAFRKILTV